MAENRHIFFICMTILVLLIASTCNAYGFFRDSLDITRPIKYHALADPNRYADRTKEYHNTMEKLKLWRRFTYDFDEDNGSSSEILNKVNDPE